MDGNNGKEYVNEYELQEERAKLGPVSLIVCQARFVTPNQIVFFIKI